MKTHFALIGGFGTLAGMNVINLVLQKVQAGADAEWPEFTLYNAAPVFTPDGVLSDEGYERLQRLTQNFKSLGCADVYVACNTVHTRSDMVYFNWVSLFETFVDKFCTRGYVVAGSTASWLGGLYSKGVWTNNIRSIIEYFIMSPNGDSAHHFKRLALREKALKEWHRLLELANEGNVPLVLGCTELSLARQEFGGCSSIQILDSAEFLANLIVARNC